MITNKLWMEQPEKFYMNPKLKVILILLPLSTAIILTTITGKLKAVCIPLLFASWITTKVTEKE